MNESHLVRVWDLPVRVFHWTLASSFFIAYLSAEESEQLHTVSGYTIGVLILFRLLWGVMGSEHARFRDFVRTPTEITHYLKDVIALRAKRYLGHNPAGGAMIIALLVSLAITTITGIATLGAEEHAGPLAGFMAQLPHAAEDVCEEAHELFANLTLLLVAFHVCGVVFSSFLHGENLIRSMVTGKKPAEVESTINHTTSKPAH